MIVAQGQGASLGVIRQHCLDCSGDSFKAALWCTVYGCHLWKLRLGLKPSTVRARYGPGLVTPGMMPDPNINLDTLSSGIKAAAAYLASDTGRLAGST
jgi:hypothetical protein